MNDTLLRDLIFMIDHALRYAKDDRTVDTLLEIRYALSPSAA